MRRQGAEDVPRECLFDVRLIAAAAFFICDEGGGRSAGRGDEREGGKAGKDCSFGGGRDFCEVSEGVRLGDAPMVAHLTAMGLPSIEPLYTVPLRGNGRGDERVRFAFEVATRRHADRTHGGRGKGKDSRSVSGRSGLRTSAHARACTRP